MNPHMKRWITGVIAVPILFGIIAYGAEELFALLIIFATLAGMAGIQPDGLRHRVSRGRKIETLVDRPAHPDSGCRARHGLCLWLF